MKVHVEELTPRGRGGVTVLAVVATDGGAARDAVRRLLPQVELTCGAPPRLVRLRHEDAKGVVEELDEALVWQRVDGVVELHLHGSPPLVERVRECLLAGAGALGVSGAASGLFPGARELEARASKALPAAPTVAAARMLLDQAEGAFRGALEDWLRLDEAGARAALAAELEERGRVAERLLEPPRVVLMGPVNSGKSTLFNLLAGIERVVVSPEPGTTRDTIEERVRVGAFAVDLVDTAGEREAAGPGAAVESAGQRLALEVAEGADLVCWIARGERPPAVAAPVVEFLGRADEPLAGLPAEIRPLAPLAEPRAALAEVERAVLEALSLPREPHRAGQAVPFDPATRALARSMRCAPELDTTSNAVRRALS